MPKNAKTAEVSFWSEEPSRYNYMKEWRTESDAYYADLRLKLQHPEVKIDGASYGHGAEMVEALLPRLVASGRCSTLEFISTTRWQATADEVRSLQGLIIRDKDRRVLLFAYGLVLDSNSQPIRSFALDQFGISSEDQTRIENCAWSRLEYSVMVQLP